MASHHGKKYFIIYFVLYSLIRNFAAWNHHKRKDYDYISIKERVR